MDTSLLFFVEPLYERGRELPRWQTSFARGWTGVLRISPQADKHGTSSLQASVTPTDAKRSIAGVAKTMRDVQLLHWDADCVLLAGVEAIEGKLPGTVHEVRQVWRLTKPGDLPD